MENNDPLHEALKEATLSVLLGSTTAPYTAVDQNGVVTHIGTITIPSAFGERIRQRAYKGEFDHLIDQAVEKLTPEHLVGALSDALVEQMLKGLESKDMGYNQRPQPGWLQQKAKDVAVEAATAALMADENFLETLRQRIGMEVDRNRVAISLQLKDPEV